MADIAQPCLDVFWFPLVSKTFCKQMIEEMENHGKWSDGGNYDSRLEGGYENVPTRDIHMRQVEWEPHWIQVLQTYIYPMQKKLFAGYDDLVCYCCVFNIVFDIVMALVVWRRDGVIGSNAAVMA